MPSWSNVGRIKGDKGDKGERGEKGEKGDAGNPLIIQGNVETVSELPTTAEYGDAFIVDGDLYVWRD